MMSTKKHHRSADNVAENDIQQIVYLQRLSVELNNVGASLLNVGGEVAAAKDLLTEALDVMRESSCNTSLKQVSLSELDHEAGTTIIGTRLAKIKQAKEKLAASLGDSSQTPREVGEEEKSHKTLFHCDPIKIDLSSYKEDALDETPAAIIMHNLSLVFYRRGRWDLALRMIETALELDVWVEGGRHSNGSLVFSILLNNLGHILINTCGEGNSCEAMVAFSEALRLGKEALDHVVATSAQEKIENMTSMRRYLARIFYNQGYVHYSEEEHDEAAECFVQTLACAPTTCQSLLLNTLKKMKDIGRFYLENGRRKDATSLYHEAIKARGKIINAGTIVLFAEVYSSIFIDVGYIYCLSGRIFEAMQHFSAALRLMTEAFGPSHSCVVGLQEHIDSLLEKLLQLSGDTSTLAAAA